MRRDADFFGDRELELVYIGKRLRDALKVENALNDAGVDYAVETDTYRGGMIFVSERVGAFFYVSPDAAGSARDVIVALGLKPHHEP